MGYQVGFIVCVEKMADPISDWLSKSEAAFQRVTENGGAALFAYGSRHPLHFDDLNLPKIEIPDNCQDEILEERRQRLYYGHSVSIRATGHGNVLGQGPSDPLLQQFRYICNAKMYFIVEKETFNKALKKSPGLKDSQKMAAMLCYLEDRIWGEGDIDRGDVLVWQLEASDSIDNTTQISSAVAAMKDFSTLLGAQGVRHVGSYVNFHYGEVPSLNEWEDGGAHWLNNVGDESLLGDIEIEGDAPYCYLEPGV